MHRGRSLTDCANLLFPYFLIILMGIICYSNSFDASFQFDDFPSIVSNESTKNLRDLRAIWQFDPSRFVVYLSFAINFYLHRFDLFGYHLVNLVIHLFSALTIYGLVRMIFMTPALAENPLAGKARNVALAVSLVFVTHPIETQAVTYIVQRTASLASLFYLLSVALYVRARLYHDRANPLHIVLYTGSLIGAILAMFTKETAATLPISILLCEFFFFSPSIKKTSGKLTYLLPMLLTLPLVPLLSLLTMKQFIGHVGLGAETNTISRLDYLLTQFNVIRTYLRLLFLPINQSLDYDYAIAGHLLEPATFASFLLHLSLLAVAIILFKRFRIISFGIAWFYLCLLVESSVIPIRDVIFEHRLYLPSFGIFLSATVLLFHLLVMRPRILFALFAVVISVLSLATINRNIVWKRDLLLWHDASKRAPNKFRVILNRGAGYSKLHKDGLALKDYDLAATINKRSALPYLNRGSISLNEGDYESAISEFNTAIRIQPNLPDAYGKRGIAFLAAGKYREAYMDYHTAAGLDPQNPFYINAMGAACNYMKRYDVALVAFTRAIAMNDRYPTPFINRAKTLLLTGRLKAAIRDLDRAAELDPDFPEIYDSRGLAHVGLSAYREAVKDFTMAIARNPGFVEAYSNRAMAYHRLGLSGRALLDLNKAVELNPSLPRLYRNRAKVLQRLGRDEEAKSDLAASEATEKGRE